MAQRRMFSKKITDTDRFLDMPLSTQALYFHLCLSADDDGFVDSTKKVMRMVGASDDDLKVLLTKQFIIGFKIGIVVIKDWRTHNYIRKDTYQKTRYVAELKQLTIDENGCYQLATPSREIGTSQSKQLNDGISGIRQHHVDEPSTSRQHGVHEPSHQVRLGKDRLGKVSNKDRSPAETEHDYSGLIKYLNSKSGKHYRNTETNRKMIRARLQEGFSESDIKQVIDNVVLAWVDDPKMQQYIRPQTIFRASKFEGYLNAPPYPPNREPPKKRKGQSYAGLEF